MKKLDVLLTSKLDENGEPEAISKLYINRINEYNLNAIPLIEKNNNIKEFLINFNGLVLTGGGDINPKYYNQNLHPKGEKPNNYRDELEFELFNVAIDLGMPILGICRGFQLINIALGGSLIQDIPSIIGNKVLHSKLAKTDVDISHNINIIKGTTLSNYYKKETADINTFHHQGVTIDVLSNILKPSAIADDGIIEAFYSDKYPMITAVQWHPERSYDKLSIGIFDEFYNNCKNYYIKRSK
ncbi:MAG: gamma-glutamyl-gamma-aminobutyrate hydrolase family protein [Christensenellaceae bacterium]|nr:gamma-glutamyl-gamma-aminobutyrate hydrolase family protein [Christensenellaceae bacterium]